MSDFEPSTNFKLTSLVRDACREFGIAALKKKLKKPLDISVSDHSTGCQIIISLKEEGHIAITVWQGSIWYSPIYEFNDKEKILGFHEDTDFAHKDVLKFFDYCRNRLKELRKKLEERREKSDDKMEKLRSEELEFYKSIMEKK